MIRPGAARSRSIAVTRFEQLFALSAEDEPTIHGAVIKPEAYLENVSQDERGELDFFDTSYTQNGRATFSFSFI